MRTLCEILKILLCTIGYINGLCKYTVRTLKYYAVDTYIIAQTNNSQRMRLYEIKGLLCEMR